MVRFSNILVAYTVIGALMWGAGAISFGQAGAAGIVAENQNGNVSGDEELKGGLNETDGPIQEGLKSVGGSSLLAVYDTVTGLLSVLFWPITVLNSVGAPPTVVVMLGGPMVMGFFASFLAFLRGA